MTNGRNAVSQTALWSNKKSSLAKLAKYKYLYLMLLPMLVYYIVFVYKPIYGLSVAFKDYNIYKGIADSPWVGLDNFIDFFSNPYFPRLLRNGLLINILSLIFGFPIPIILALMMNEIQNKKFRKTVQTLTYLPHFISVVVICGIVIRMLSPSGGLVNAIISVLGGDKIYFLSKPEWFRPIYILMGIWKESGFGTIVFLAALSGIDTQLYDAAQIDGAGKWRQTLSVTLPGIMPTIIIMLIMRMGSMLDAGYESIILLYQPTTYETADVFSSFIYRAGLENAQFSMGAVAGLFNSLTALALVSMANFISRKVSETSLW